MTIFKSVFFNIIFGFFILSTADVQAQTLSDLSDAEGFEAPVPVFGTPSELSYPRDNLKPEGNLTLGAWYSQADALALSFGISQDNLFGTDEEFRLNIEASRYTQTAQITLTDPDFYESEYSRRLSLSTYNARPNQSQNGSYEFSGAEASIAFGRQVSDAISLSFGGGFGASRIKDDPSLPSFIQDYVALEGEDQKSVFGFFNLVYDQTDGTANPRSGYRAGVANELGLVGDTAYLKSEVKAAYFAPIGRHGNVKLHGNLGLGDTIGTGTFPIYENYFAGGPGSVRGYAANTLGPTSTIPGQTDLANAGGQLRLTGGVEMATRLAGRDDLHVLGFVDVGNVFAQIDDLEFSELRSSIGVGVRWDTAIGPLNVYISHALDDAPGDALEVMQFTLGARF